MPKLFVRVKDIPNDLIADREVSSVQTADEKTIGIIAELDPTIGDTSIRLGGGQRMKKKFLLTTAAAVAALSNAQPIFAQEAAAPAAAEEEKSIQSSIVVTARKKEELLLDAPIAISAFSEEAIDAAGYVDIVDISKATPGLFVEPFSDSLARVNTTPRFRGIFFTSGSPLQQTATVFLDGVYMSSGASTIGINELARVEVIKGPQSALFGRNTFAGAINYVSKDPSDYFKGEVDLTVASKNEQSIAVGFEGPITDMLSYRVGGSYDSKEGHYDNVGNPGQKLGDESQWNINGTLLFEPTDDLRIKVRGSYQEIDDGPAAVVSHFGTLQHNFGGFAIDPVTGAVNQADSQSPAFGSRTESVFAGTITVPPADRIGVNSTFANLERFRDAILADGRYATTDAINDFEYNPFNTNDFGLNLDSTRIAANLSWDITDTITLDVQGGYNEESNGFWWDFDASPDHSFMSFSARDIEDYSAEARLSGLSLNDKLSWSVGASITDIDITSLGGTASFFGPTILFSDIFRSDPFHGGATTTGYFASLDYEITDDWSVTVEGRFQEDEIRDDDVNASLTTPISPTTIESFLPRLTVRWEPSDSTTLYATYSEGNLPGGFNAEVAELDAAQIADLNSKVSGVGVTFDEETLKNHELGWKQEMFDGRVAFNTAAFYMKREDEIFSAFELVIDTTPGAPNPFRTVSFTNNGASTEIYGVEIDGRASITDNLTFEGSFAYIDAEIASFPEGTSSGDFNDIFGDAANVAGQQAPRFPPMSASAALSYERDVSGFGPFDSMFARGDVFYTDGFYSSNANVAETDTATDVNIRGGLRNDNFGVELFVTNLFEEDVPASVQNFADTSFGTRLQPGGFFNFSREGNRLGLRDKRQIGVRLNLTF